MPTVTSRKKADGSVVYRCLARTWKDGKQVNITRTKLTYDEAYAWGEAEEEKMRRNNMLAELEAMGVPRPDRSKVASTFTRDMLRSGSVDLDFNMIGDTVSSGLEHIISHFGLKSSAISVEDLVGYFTRRHGENASFWEVDAEAGLLKLFLNLTTGEAIHHGGNRVKLALDEVARERGSFKAEHEIAPTVKPEAEVQRVVKSEPIAEMEETVEQAVARLSAEGLSVRKIADRLGIGKSTVARILK
ncbi:helix-turn-helix domain-containing protein [Kistimonas asteriae]|uniref:helix-turn-helix domain-containing protein n=1 Tax=Kistimonas asteriae TaxID=517724 RepID=UPI001BAAA3CD|nr:helix-turn-helix domain-containing protein [Kistimonas asteriae]